MTSHMLDENKAMNSTGIGSLPELIEQLGEPDASVGNVKYWQVSKVVQYNMKKTVKKVSISEQHEIIIDWIYEHDNECFSLYDLSFLDYWSSKTNGLPESILQRRINELVKEGRLDYRIERTESTAPAGIPKKFKVYY